MTDSNRELVNLSPGNDAAAPGVRVWLAQDDAAPAGFGRVMVEMDGQNEPALPPIAIFSFAAKLLGVLSPASPRLSGNIALSGKAVANDNAFWLGAEDEDYAGDGGIFASDVDATTLADGTTVVAWVGQDQRVHAKTIPASDDNPVDPQATARLDALLADLGDAGQNGHGAGRLRISTFGQNGLAAIWIADFGMTAALMGKALMLGGSTGNQGLGVSDGWKLRPLDPIPVPRDASGLALNVKASGALTVTFNAASQAADGEASFTHDVSIPAELFMDALACETDPPVAGDEGPTVRVALDVEAPLEDVAETAPVTQPSPEAVEAREDAGETSDVGATTEQRDTDAGSVSDVQGTDQSSSPIAAAQDQSTAQDSMVVAALDEIVSTDETGLEAVPAGDTVPAVPASGSVTDAEPSGDATHDTGSTGAPAGDGDTGASGNPSPVDTAETPQEPAVIVISGVSGFAGQSAPQAVNGPQNTVTVLYQQEGTQPGQTTLVITSLTPGTSAVAPPVILTQNAITAIADDPQLDLQPALATVDDVTAVVWAESSPDGTSLAVKIQAYSPDGSFLAPEPVVVAAGESGETLSDFAVAGWSRCHSRSAVDDENTVTEMTPVAGAGDTGPTGAPNADLANGEVTTAELSDAANTTDNAPEPDAPRPVAADLVAAEPAIAVAWVMNADASGYGTIMGQRFAIQTTHEPGGVSGHDVGGSAAPGLVALGADGHAGDGHDGPFAFATSSNDGAVGDAIGRSPMLADAGHGALVVGWIAETSPGSGVEVIDGVVLNEDGVQSPLAFDLTSLMPRGLLKDSQPTIQATEDGDIVIGWVQPAEGEDAGYEAVIAIYRRDDDGNWVAPDDTQTLASFEDKPKGLAFALSDGEEERVSVSWIEKGRVYGETFDLEGASLDQFSYKAGKGTSGSMAQDSVIGEGHLAAVIDGTGGLVVVFAENDGDDTGLGAVMVTLGQADKSGSGSQAGVGLVVEVLSYDEVSVQVPAAVDSQLAYADEDADAIVFADALSGAPETAAGGDAAGEPPDLNADGLLYNSGYGNDIADYYDEAELAEDIDVDDALAQAFDALQFANALNSVENMEVLTFDVSNVVLIRDFDAL